MRYALLLAVLFIAAPTEAKRDYYTYSWARVAVPPPQTITIHDNTDKTQLDRIEREIISLHKDLYILSFKIPRKGD